MKGAGGILLLIAVLGTIVRYAVWIALAFAVVVTLVGLWWFAGRLDRWLEAREGKRAAAHAKLAAVAARADQQHAWTLAGDDRGTFGDYRPEV